MNLQNTKIAIFSEQQFKINIFTPDVQEAIKSLDKRFLESHPEIA